MNTLLVDDPTQIKTRIVYTESLGLIEPLKVAEEKESNAPIQTVIHAPAQVHRAGSLVRITKQAVAFYDWLSGPSLSRRDRIETTTDEYERVRHFAGIV